MCKGIKTRYLFIDIRKVLKHFVPAGWPNFDSLDSKFITFPKERNRAKQPHAHRFVVLDVVATVVRAIRSAIGRGPVVVVEHPTRSHGKNPTPHNSHRTTDTAIDPKRLLFYGNLLIMRFGA